MSRKGLSCSSILALLLSTLIFTAAMPNVNAQVPTYSVDANPSRILEGRRTTITVAIVGGEALTLYSFTVTVVDPTGAGYTETISFTTDLAGAGSNSADYPNDFTGNANTDYVGRYSVIVDQTVPTFVRDVATGAFVVGLTDKTSYTLGETVSIRGSGYMPDETVTINITHAGAPVPDYPKNVTADGGGIVRDSWIIPSNASYGMYTVTLGGAITAKSPSDIQTFAIAAITLSPTHGVIGTSVSVEGVGFTVNSAINIMWNSYSVANTSSDSTGSFATMFTVPPSTAGNHTVKASDATGFYATSIFAVDPSVVLAPTKGIVGSSITIVGTGFAGDTNIDINFNDMPVAVGGTDDFGNFAAVFNVPIAVAGGHTVRAIDRDRNYAEATFTVIDATPLDIRIDVGSAYFSGEVAEFYVLMTFNNTRVNATITEATLYRPDGTSEDLKGTDALVSTGLYKITYNISADAPTGAYMLVIKASYTTDIVDSKGDSLKSFLISPTLTNWDTLLEEVQSGIATIINYGLAAIVLAAIAMIGAWTAVIAIRKRKTT